ncbi:unnamed protein product [Tilletia controversa]|uniref:mRNA stability protein n=3 Tax=Tilletia TaxID=13289 RepID=A0A8X7SZP1_9BASI|nr:hypothetical protein CF328_g4675 [Tilletia controversa]KAE8248234.1 hypothetical protein A4X03_0g6835 [Tilletia caries]CAD6901359.1 unnamed protein product [Tilletia laevis]KAE8253352.1 hypothetical protein A4X06_0g1513 [Tilletia controversa]CAD6884893.1 unnamed protein product [Tilletia caries]
MLPAQRNKIDVSSLSEEEQKNFRLYGKLPSRANVRPNKSHERKYFDSGDYALSKAGKAPQQSVGTAIPNPERVPHASTVGGGSVPATVGSLTSPVSAAVGSPMAAVGMTGSFPAATAAPLSAVSPLSSVPPSLTSGSDSSPSPFSPTAASGSTAVPLPIAGASSQSASSSSASSSPIAMSPPPSAAQTSSSPLGLASRNQPLGSFPVASAHAQSHAAAAAAAAASSSSSTPTFESPFPGASPIGTPGSAGSFGAVPAGGNLGPGIASRYLHRGSLSGSPGKEASSGLARSQPLSAEDMMEE